MCVFVNYEGGKLCLHQSKTVPLVCGNGKGTSMDVCACALAKDQ